MELGDVALDVSLLLAPPVVCGPEDLAAGVGAAGSGAEVVLRAGRTGVGSTGAADAWTDVRLAGTGAGSGMVGAGAAAGAGAGAGAGVVVVAVAAGAFC